MADIDTNTALIIAAISSISAIIGASIGAVTNYLIEWQRNTNEEKRHKQEEETKELSLHYQAYNKFLGIKFRDVHEENENLETCFDPDPINEIYASVMIHGSPKVSSLLARSFPPKSWEDIETTKLMLMSELVLEKGGKLPLSTSIEAAQANMLADIGIGDGLKKEAKKKGWWQFWK